MSDRHSQRMRRDSRHAFMRVADEDGWMDGEWMLSRYVGVCVWVSYSQSVIRDLIV